MTKPWNIEGTARAFLGRGTRGLFSSLGLPFVIVLLGLLLQYFHPDFLTSSNLENIVRQGGPLALIAFGQAFVVIAGGLDLSVGSVMGIVSVSVAMAGLQWGLWPGVLCGVAVGCLCGAINGLMVSRFRVPPFVATLGMLSIARGMALTVTDGMTVDVPEGFSYLGWANWGPIPVMAVLVLIVFFICFGLLNLTTFGRKIYSTGANPETTRLSGISIGGYRFTAFLLSGALCALGAILMASRMNSGNPLTGVGFELRSIAAVVLGGVSLRGGEGSLLGVLFGVIFFTSLSNGLRLIGFSSYLTLMAEGVIFVLAVWINLALYRRR